MNLQNGYKVIYEKAADGKRAFYASKTGLFKDAELIAEATIGEFKLIYEKNGMFYGSTTGIPAEGDHCFEEFRAVFEEGYSATETTTEPEEDEPETVTPDPEEDEVVEDEVVEDEVVEDEEATNEVEEPADETEEPAEE